MNPSPSNNKTTPTKMNTSTCIPNANRGGASPALIKKALSFLKSDDDLDANTNDLGYEEEGTQNQQLTQVAAEGEKTRSGSQKPPDEWEKRRMGGESHSTSSSIGGNLKALTDFEKHFTNHKNPRFLSLLDIGKLREEEDQIKKDDARRREAREEAERLVRMRRDRLRKNNPMQFNKLYGVGVGGIGGPFEGSPLADSMANRDLRSSGTVGPSGAVAKKMAVNLSNSSSNSTANTRLDADAAMRAKLKIANGAEGSGPLVITNIVSESLLHQQQQKSTKSLQQNQNNLRGGEKGANTSAGAGGNDDNNNSEEETDALLTQEKRQEAHQHSEKEREAHEAFVRKCMLFEDAVESSRSLLSKTEQLILQHKHRTEEKKKERISALRAANELYSTNTAGGGNCGSSPAATTTTTTTSTTTATASFAALGVTVPTAAAAAAGTTSTAVNGILGILMQALRADDAIDSGEALVPLLPPHPPPRLRAEESHPTSSTTNNAPPENNNTNVNSEGDNRNRVPESDQSSSSPSGERALMSSAPNSQQQQQQQNGTDAAAANVNANTNDTVGGGGGGSSAGTGAGEDDSFAYTAWLDYMRTRGRYTAEDEAAEDFVEELLSRREAHEAARLMQRGDLPVGMNTEHLLMQTTPSSSSAVSIAEINYPQRVVPYSRAIHHQRDIGDKNTVDDGEQRKEGASRAHETVHYDSLTTALIAQQERHTHHSAAAAKTLLKDSSNYAAIMAAIKGEADVMMKKGVVGAVSREATKMRRRLERRERKSKEDQAKRMLKYATQSASSFPHQQQQKGVAGGGEERAEETSFVSSSSFSSDFNSSDSSIDLQGDRNNDNNEDSDGEGGGGSTFHPSDLDSSISSSSSADENNKHNDAADDDELLLLLTDAEIAERELKAAKAKAKKERKKRRLAMWKISGVPMLVDGDEDAKLRALHEASRRRMRTEIQAARQGQGIMAMGTANSRKQKIDAWAQTLPPQAISEPIEEDIVTKRRRLRREAADKISKIESQIESLQIQLEATRTKAAAMPAHQRGSSGLSSEMETMEKRLVQLAGQRVAAVERQKQLKNRWHRIDATDAAAASTDGNTDKKRPRFPLPKKSAAGDYDDAAVLEFLMSTKEDEEEKEAKRMYAGANDVVTGAVGGGGRRKNGAEILPDDGFYPTMGQTLSQVLASLGPPAPTSVNDVPHTVIDTELTLEEQLLFYKHKCREHELHSQIQNNRIEEVERFLSLTHKRLHLLASTASSANSAVTAEVHKLLSMTAKAMAQNERLWKRIENLVFAARATVRRVKGSTILSSSFMLNKSSRSRGGGGGVDEYDEDLENSEDSALVSAYGSSFTRKLQKWRRKVLALQSRLAKKENESMSLQEDYHRLEHAYILLYVSSGGLGEDAALAVSGGGGGNSSSTLLLSRFLGEGVFDASSLFSKPRVHEAVAQQLRLLNEGLLLHASSLVPEGQGSLEDKMNNETEIEKGEEERRAEGKGEGEDDSKITDELRGEPDNGENADTAANSALIVLGPGNRTATAAALSRAGGEQFAMFTEVMRSPLSFSAVPEDGCGEERASAQGGGGGGGRRKQHEEEEASEGGTTDADEEDAKEEDNSSQKNSKSNSNVSIVKLPYSRESFRESFIALAQSQFLTADAAASELMQTIASAIELFHQKNYKKSASKLATFRENLRDHVRSAVSSSLSDAVAFANNEITRKVVCDYETQLREQRKFFLREIKKLSSEGAASGADIERRMREAAMEKRREAAKAAALALHRENSERAEAEAGRAAQIKKFNALAQQSFFDVNKKYCLAIPLPISSPLTLLFRSSVGENSMMVASTTLLMAIMARGSGLNNRQLVSLSPSSNEKRNSTIARERGDSRGKRRADEGIKEGGREVSHPLQLEEDGDEESGGGEAFDLFMRAGLTNPLAVFTDVAAVNGGHRGVQEHLTLLNERFSAVIAARKRQQQCLENNDEGGKACLPTDTLEGNTKTIVSKVGKRTKNGRGGKGLEEDEAAAQKRQRDEREKAARAATENGLMMPPALSSLHHPHHPQDLLRLVIGFLVELVAETCGYFVSVANEEMLKSFEGSLMDEINAEVTTNTASTTTTEKKGVHKAEQGEEGLSCGEEGGKSSSPSPPPNTKTGGEGEEGLPDPNRTTNVFPCSPTPATLRRVLTALVPISRMHSIGYYMDALEALSTRVSSGEGLVDGFTEKDLMLAGGEEITTRGGTADGDVKENENKVQNQLTSLSLTNAAPSKGVSSSSVPFAFATDSVRVADVWWRSVAERRPQVFPLSLETEEDNTEEAREPTAGTKKQSKSGLPLPSAFLPPPSKRERLLVGLLTEGLLDRRTITIPTADTNTTPPMPRMKEADTRDVGPNPCCSDSQLIIKRNSNDNNNNNDIVKRRLTTVVTVRPRRPYLTDDHLRTYRALTSMVGAYSATASFVGGAPAEAVVAEVEAQQTSGGLLRGAPSLSSSGMPSPSLTALLPPPSGFMSLHPPSPAVSPSQKALPPQAYRSSSPQSPSLIGGYVARGGGGTATPMPPPPPLSGGCVSADALTDAQLQHLRRTLIITSPAAQRMAEVYKRAQHRNRLRRRQQQQLNSRGGAGYGSGTRGMTKNSSDLFALAGGGGRGEDDQEEDSYNTNTNNNTMGNNTYANNNGRFANERGKGLGGRHRRQYNNDYEEDDNNDGFAYDEDAYDENYDEEEEKGGGGGGVYEHSTSRDARRGAKGAREGRGREAEAGRRRAKGKRNTPHSEDEHSERRDASASGGDVGGRGPLRRTWQSAPAGDTSGVGTATVLPSKNNERRHPYLRRWGGGGEDGGWHGGVDDNDNVPLTAFQRRMLYHQAMLMSSGAAPLKGQNTNNKNAATGGRRRQRQRGNSRVRVAYYDDNGSSSSDTSAASTSSSSASTAATVAGGEEGRQPLLLREELALSGAATAAELSPTNEGKSGKRNSNQNKNKNKNNKKNNKKVLYRDYFGYRVYTNPEDDPRRRSQGEGRIDSRNDSGSSSRSSSEDHDLLDMEERKRGGGAQQRRLLPFQSNTNIVDKEISERVRRVGRQQGGFDRAAEASLQKKEEANKEGGHYNSDNAGRSAAHDTARPSSASSRSSSHSSPASSSPQYSRLKNRHDALRSELKALTLRQYKMGDYVKKMAEENVRLRRALATAADRNTALHRELDGVYVDVDGDGYGGQEARGGGEGSPRQGRRRLGGGTGAAGVGGGGGGYTFPYFSEGGRREGVDNETSNVTSARSRPYEKYAAVALFGGGGGGGGGKATKATAAGAVSGVPAILGSAPPVLFGLNRHYNNNNAPLVKGGEVGRTPGGGAVGGGVLLPPLQLKKAQLLQEDRQGLDRPGGVYSLSKTSSSTIQPSVFSADAQGASVGSGPQDRQPSPALLKDSPPLLPLGNGLSPLHRYLLFSSGSDAVTSNIVRQQQQQQQQLTTRTINTAVAQPTLVHVGPPSTGGPRDPSAVDGGVGRGRGGGGFAEDNNDNDDDEHYAYVDIRSFQSMGADTPPATIMTTNNTAIMTSGMWSTCNRSQNTALSSPSFPTNSAARPTTSSLSAAGSPAVSPARYYGQSPAIVRPPHHLSPMSPPTPPAKPNGR